MVSLPSRKSQIRTEPSAEPRASLRPSGLRLRPVAAAGRIAAGPHGQVGRAVCDPLPRGGIGVRIPFLADETQEVVRGFVWLAQAVEADGLGGVEQGAGITRLTFPGDLGAGSIQPRPSL